MKKNILVALVIAVLFVMYMVLAGCSSDEVDDIIGKWETNVTLEYLGWADLPEETLVIMGIDPNATYITRTKTFVADGSISIDTIGDAEIGTWHTDGYYLHTFFTDSCCGFTHEERVRFSVIGNTLTLGSGSDAIEFTRK